MVSYSVKWKYWSVPCRENEILAYMVTILINMKVKLVPWFKTWYLNLFGFKFGKMKVLKWLLSRCLINGKFEVVPWCPLLQTRYVNLFGFEFGKIKVLDWFLSRKWDFVLYAYNFYKWDVWLVPWYETWYLSLFNFVFSKMEVLEWLCIESIWFCIR